MAMKKTTAPRPASAMSDRAKNISAEMSLFEKTKILIISRSSVMHLRILSHHQLAPKEFSASVVGSSETEGLL